MGKRSFRYTTNAQGLILKRDEIGNGAVNRHHDYYYVDGKRVGDVGNDGDARVDYAQSLAQKGSSRDVDSYKKWQPVSSADFDQNYEPIGPSYPGQALTHYTVHTGDTLQGIALSLWGDSALWYLLADANGLTGSEALTAGQILTVPNKVTNIHNNSATMRVYNPGEAIGDTSPTLPKAPPPPSSGGGCGGFGQIIVAIVAIVVAVVLTIFVPALGAGMWGALAKLAIVGAGTSIAAQGTAMAVGIQDKFSWSQVGVAAVSSMVTGGIGDKAFTGSFGFITNETVRSSVQAAARAIAGNTVSQGISVATDLQDKFSWSSVAAAGLGAAVASGINSKLPENMRPPEVKQAMTGQQLAGSMLIGMGATVAQTSVRGFNKVNWGEIAATNFGNALGDQIAGSIAQKYAPASTPTTQTTATQVSEIDPNRYGLYGYDAYNLDRIQNIGTITEPEYRSYTVKKGESAASIAQQLTNDPRKARTIAAQILEMNNITNPRNIKIGMELILPNENTPAPTTGIDSYNKDVYLEAQRQKLLAQRRTAQQNVVKQNNSFTWGISSFNSENLISDLTNMAGYGKGKFSLKDLMSKANSNFESTKHLKYQRKIPTITQWTELDEAAHQKRLFNQSPTGQAHLYNAGWAKVGDPAVFGTMRTGLAIAGTVKLTIGALNLYEENYTQATQFFTHSVLDFFGAKLASSSASTHYATVNKYYSTPMTTSLDIGAIRPVESNLSNYAISGKISSNIAGKGEITPLKAFSNLFPEDIARTPKIIPNEKLTMISQKKLAYVVKEDGTLIVGKNNMNQGHIDLAGGQPVLAAGRVRVHAGEIKYIDNFSGHYRPSGIESQRAAEAAFKRLGFNVEGKYIERTFK